MTISTYTELKAEVTDFSHRSDLATKMDTFTLLAEAVINKDLRSVEMEQITQFSLDADSIPLPDGYMKMRYVMRDATTHLDNLPLNILQGRYDTTSGNPRGYSIAGDEIFFLPGGTVADPIAITLIYYKRVPTLTANTTNDILTIYPMIYLSAMMLQVYLYLQDDEELSKWAEIYKSQIAMANKSTSGYVRPQVRIA